VSWEVPSVGDPARATARPGAVEAQNVMVEVCCTF
jgi:hypothetical protein